MYRVAASCRIRTEAISTREGRSLVQVARDEATDTTLAAADVVRAVGAAQARAAGAGLPRRADVLPDGTPHSACALVSGT